ncbi:MAG: UDP-N-acetylmuramate--L-alanine ligase [Candidatus Harrisonbacteria bacterium]|nr:UDP-N-acetylmuramate--L-alanine ligase [Candidatus Harrisonbacteria bacterium]
MDIRKAHFIGIGGIGISAIARMMLGEGKEVSGSDVSRSEIIDELEKLGAKIYFGHDEKNLKDVDLVVYTPAVKENNPELVKAKKLGIQTLSYPEMLGIISRDKYTIAVSGAHGKTTTTAMIGTILKDSGLDPTIIVGSLLKDSKSNFVAGRRKYFVVEACEYKKSFLNINPKIIVITNIDNDHLDYYGNVRNIQKAFSEFVSKLTSEDYLVCNPRGRYLDSVVKNAKCKIVDYTKSPRNLKLKVVGDHNLDNAQAAFAVAKILKVKESEARKSLENFSGTWRRFEYKGKTRSGAYVYDDYGHHPTEIKATLAGARQAFPHSAIFCIFQPHLYSRTKLLLNDFSKSFNDADAVLVADIYAAREKDDGTHSTQLVNKMKKFHKNVRYVDSFNNAASVLILEPKKGDIILTMGAGDIYKVGDLLLGALTR